MPPLERSDSTKKYWRSLNELEETPEFQELLETEFPGGPEEDWTESSRRRFLQLMGASVALGTASSCRWQKEYIAPMADRPENWIPGKPRHYSTMMQLGGVAESLVATSYDGRPTKIEGNAQNAASKGATSVYAQGATLELCDPDRSQGVAQFVDGQEVESDMAAFDSFLSESVLAGLGNGSSLAILTGANSSPAFAELKASFQSAYPQVRFVSWEAWSRHNEEFGLESIFGTKVRPVYHLADADIVLSLDEDLLGAHPDRLRLSREFASRRRPEERVMNRAYSVEANFSLTGAAADHRLPVKASQVGVILAALQSTLASDHGVGAAPSNAPSGGILAEERTQKFVTALAGDLAANRSRCVIAVGASQPASVHAQAHALNIALGNRGKTVEYHVSTEAPASHSGELMGLVSAMNAGQIQTLLFMGANPSYDAPADLGFGEATAKVANKIHLGLYRDETALQSDWHVPAAHWLEGWGDARTWDGTHTLAQPLIAPLYGGLDQFQFLGKFMSTGEPSAENAVRETFAAMYGSDELTWRKAVQRGFQPGTSFVKAGAAQGAAASMNLANSAAWAEGQPLELCFNTDATLYDGRFANSGWLQELPDPMTKLTWDNAAIMGAGTADALGIKDHDLVSLDVNGRKLDAAVYIMPGQAPGTIGLSLGYGRTAAGHVAGLNADHIDPVGFNSYAVRTTESLGFATTVNVSKTGRRYELASTQDHHVIDEIGQKGRGSRIGQLVREGSLDEWKDHPDFAQHRVHHPPLVSTWEERDWTVDDKGQPTYRWGMSIDLSSCTGCSACTIACQAENNIPIVGKEQVIKGREMAWIRMDRYFTGDVENPQVAQQPVGCQHCENAPCEQVCPVAATVHSSEGLNDMVYNRCIGTRYCSNNCPYKVRRFNYLNWNKDLKEEGAEVRKLSMNPQVTVRVRGVMEKCSYCVQRIASARVDRHTKGDRIQDGDVVTACQQVCPADAIHFGDLNDSESQISKAHGNDRAYKMLAELNNKPRTAYLAAIRNPHPDLAPAYEPGGHGGHGGHDDHGHDDGHGHDAEPHAGDHAETEVEHV